MISFGVAMRFWSPVQGQSASETRNAIMLHCFSLAKGFVMSVVLLTLAGFRLMNEATE